MFADAAGIPLPQSYLQRTDPALEIATGFVDAVRVDLTRPQGGAFRVRIYAEEYPPPEAEIVGAFVLYGTSVPEIGRRLDAAWRSLSLNPVACVRSVAFLSFDHSRRFRKVLRTIEALQPQFPP